MENKAKNQQSNNEKKEEWPNEKTYDVFISYRRTPSSVHQQEQEQIQRHSTSLARSIALELKQEGFKVHFDCWENNNDFMEKIEQSKYFFVLLTSYSWDDDNEQIKRGENFKEEINKIKDGIKKGKISRDNVLWLDVDDSAKNRIVKNENGEIKNVRHEEYEKLINEHYQITSFPTKPESLIKDFIDKPKNGKGRKIKKFPRFSYNFYKIASLIICILAMIALAFCIHQTSEYKSMYNNTQEELKACRRDSLNKYIDSLKLYKTERIIFAGGRTVQQYINSFWNIDVNNYKPNGHYIHFPSIPAQQLLWDDVNEDSVRKQCPIVLSAAEIDTNNANTSELKSKGRRVAAYLLDNIPLKVQVYNHHGSENDTIPITPYRLRKLLLEKNTTIWTTTKESGTFLEYKKLLDINGVFDLDSLVNNQNGGRHDFDLVQNIKVDDKNTQNIFLLNDHYYYPNPKGYPEKSYSIVKDNSLTATLPLYVYTIAINNQDKKEVELLPQAKEFLNKIGCNTEPIPTPNDIIVPWPKRQ